MIIALLASALAAALLGGMAGGPDVFEQVVKEWKRGIKRKISDPKAQARAFEILEEFKALVSRLSEQVLTDSKSLQSVNENYHATIEDYTPVVETIAANMLTVQTAMVALSWKLRQEIGDEAFDSIHDKIIKEQHKNAKKKAKADARAQKKAEKKQRHAS